MRSASEMRQNPNSRCEVHGLYVLLDVDDWIVFYITKYSEKACILPYPRIHDSPLILPVKFYLQNKYE